MTARVLVVEDDPDLAALEADVLEERGHAVEIANNGKEALEAVQRAAPDIILLDMKMPVMGGREFAEEYRRRESRAAPIVVVTAADDAQRRAGEARREGGEPLGSGASLISSRRGNSTRRLAYAAAGDAFARTSLQYSSAKRSKSKSTARKRSRMRA